MDIMNVLGKLDRVKRTGVNKWQASCPCGSAHSHNDKTRSLSVAFDENTGNILLYCHTGCSIDNICAALGCDKKDLCADTEAGKRASFINWFASKNGLRYAAEYSYCYGPYRDGLAKVRFYDNEGEKTFRWIKTDANAKSGYKMTHEGCPHRLYICGKPGADTVFLVEGEKDADTLHNITGFTAASTEDGATKGEAGEKWREEYTRQLEGKTVYILWDNDEAGKRFSDIEAQHLAGYAAHVYKLDLLKAWPQCPEKGDISDLTAAIGDAEAARLVKEMISNAQEVQKAQDAQEVQEPAQQAEQPATNDGIGAYIAGSMRQEIADFIKASDIKTGFSRFDLLAGGIYPGLYAIGAISSLGKTTFIHQLADQIAAAGKHVLFFSLEMSRLEMATKSISRKTAQLDYSNAISSLKIRRGVTSALVERATKEYIDAVGDRMNIIEGGFETTVSQISDYTRQYIARHEVRPIIIVDYLQILQGAPKNTVREAIDFNVVELKRLSRALGVPVIVISSVNRGNYLMPVDFESFKESGGIEFTCDVCLGLQLACLDEPLFDKEKQIKEKRERIKQAKGENPRRIKLVCLKNRYGSPDWTIDYKYYPQYDFFEEQDGYTVVNEKTPWD